MEKLLIIGSTKGTWELLDYAKSIGMYVIVADRTIRRPEYMADEFWNVDIEDVDILEEKCIEKKVTSVVCGFEDWHRLQRIVNQLSKRLRFPMYVTDDALQNMTESLASICSMSNVMYGNAKNNDRCIATYAVSFSESKLLALCECRKDHDGIADPWMLTTNDTEHDGVYRTRYDDKVQRIINMCGISDGIVSVYLSFTDDDALYVEQISNTIDYDLVATMYSGMLRFDCVKYMIDCARGIRHTKYTLMCVPNGRPQELRVASYLLVSKSDADVAAIEGLDLFASMPGVHTNYDCMQHSHCYENEVLGSISFVAPNKVELGKMIRRIDSNARVLDENGNDILIKFFDLEKVDEQGERENGKKN